jgi:hypothetical protein
MNMRTSPAGMEQNADEAVLRTGVSKDAGKYGSKQ